MSTPAATGTTVAQIIADILGEAPEALADQPILAAHAWDSLASLEAFAQLEAAFAVQLDLTAFHAARTVEDLAELVRKAASA